MFLLKSRKSKYDDSHQFVVLPAARVVVYDRDEVVSDVTLLLVALRVLLQVRRHQRGHVEDDLEQKIMFFTTVRAQRPKR